jgi:glycerophosphoryl diester phosphodiesterase
MENLEDFARKDGVFLAAHRGASGLVTENTLLAYERAIEEGADMIETDIRLSSDGKVYSYHDDVSVASDGTEINLWEKDFENTSRLLDSRPPLLDDILELVKNKTYLMIEIKSDFSDGIVKRAIQIVEKVKEHRYLDYTLFGSFDYRILEAINKNYDNVNTAAIKIPGDTTPILELKDKLGIKALVCSTEECNNGLMEQAKASDVLVGVYGINSADTYKEMIALGIKCVVTDYPDRIKKLML